MEMELFRWLQPGWFICTFYRLPREHWSQWRCWTSRRNMFTVQLAFIILLSLLLHPNASLIIPLRHFIKYNWTWLKAGRSQRSELDRNSILQQTETFNSTNSWELSNKIIRVQFFITERFPRRTGRLRWKTPMGQDSDMQLGDLWIWNATQIAVKMPPWLRVMLKCCQAQKPPRTPLRQGRFV